MHKGLADIVDEAPLTIQLRFEHRNSQQEEADDAFHKALKASGGLKAACCGCQSALCMGASDAHTDAADTLADLFAAFPPCGLADE